MYKQPLTVLKLKRIYFMLCCQSTEWPNFWWRRVVRMTRFYLVHAGKWPTMSPLKYVPFCIALIAIYEEDLIHLSLIAKVGNRLRYKHHEWVLYTGFCTQQLATDCAVLLYRWLDWQNGSWDETRIKHKLTLGLIGYLTIHCIKGGAHVGLMSNNRWISPWSCCNQSVSQYAFISTV